MLPTPFGEILRNAVENTPGAVGGALAASDGELVDSWTLQDSSEWAILTAHLGILVSHVRSAIHTFHFGGIDSLYFSFEGLDLAVQALPDDYFAILAIAPPVSIGKATHSLELAAQALLTEMR